MDGAGPYADQVRDLDDPMAGSELFTDLALLVGSETWPERWQVASCRRQRVLEGAVACFRPKFFVEPQPVSWVL